MRIVGRGCVDSDVLHGSVSEEQEHFEGEMRAGTDPRQQLSGAMTTAKWGGTSIEGKGSGGSHGIEV